jgi:hypothetical protein
MNSKRLRPLIASFGLAFSVQAASDTDCSGPVEANSHTYPTAVIADYVLGCLLANGATPDAMQKCACSVDFVAAAIPYEEYEQAEALLRLQQVPGEGRNAVYKNSAWSKALVTRLREVQAESTLRCF